MRSKNAFLGAVLVALGVLWLLSSLDVFDFSMHYLVTAFTKLWPLIIVLIGASMIIQNKVAERLLWVAFLLVVLGYSIFLQVGNPFSNGNSGSGNPVVDTYSYPMEENLTEGELQIEIGATLFELDSGDSDKVLELETTMEELYVDLDIVGESTYVEINNQSDIVHIGDLSDNSLSLGINDSIPWEVVIKCGAVDADLDFSDILLKQLDLSLGAGDMTIRLGDELDEAVFNMKSGVSQVDIYLPKDADITINMNGALNTTNIDTLNFTKEGSTYTNDAGNDADAEIQLNLEVGLGQVQFYLY